MKLDRCKNSYCKRKLTAIVDQADDFSNDKNIGECTFKVQIVVMAICLQGHLTVDRKKRHYLKASWKNK